MDKSKIIITLVPSSLWKLDVSFLFNLFAIIYWVLLFFLYAAENRKILHEEEVEKCLVALLGTDNEGTKIAAAQAISAMCENLASKQTTGTLGKSVMEEARTTVCSQCYVVYRSVVLL